MTTHAPHQKSPRFGPDPATAGKPPGGPPGPPPRPCERRDSAVSSAGDRSPRPQICRPWGPSLSRGRAGLPRCPLIAAATLAELTAPDVVVIGGSLSEEDPDDQVMHWAAPGPPPPLPGRPACASVRSTSP